MKKLPKKLTLRTETLRQLDDALAVVVGAQRTSVGSRCYSLDGGSSCCTIESKCASLCCY